MLDQLDAAGQRVVRTVAGLDDEALRGPSLLPGWTRGHVLAHIARNGDGIANMMRWARTGEVSLMYPTRANRTFDIDAGSARPHTVALDDLTASVANVLCDLRHLPAEAWDREVALGPGPLSDTMPRMTARTAAFLRLFEVEVHHVDLDGGYSFSDTPHDLMAEMLTLSCSRATVDGDGFTLLTTAGTWPVGGGGSVHVTALPADALAWLLGRSAATGVSVAGGGTLPVIKPL